jgi:hypothetical protein
MYKYRVTELIKDLSSITSKTTLGGNTQKSSKTHSTEVKFVLEKYGFKEHTNTIHRDLVYKEQPNGTQSFPDFLLINKQKTLNFELKKSNTNTIMWNDNFPKINTLYLISCRDFTRLCTGQRLRTNKDLEKYEKLCEQIKTLNLEFKNQSSNFTFYTRKAISQKIESSNNDFQDCYSILLSLINE